MKGLILLLVLLGTTTFVASFSRTHGVIDDKTPRYELKKNCMFESGSADTAGCYMWKYDQAPAIKLVCYKTLDGYAASKSVGLLQCIQWANNIREVLDKIYSLAKGKDMIDGIQTANPAVRKLGTLPQSPIIKNFKLKNDKTNLAIIRKECTGTGNVAPKIEVTTKRFSSAAAAMDRTAATTPHRGSDSKFVVETCFFRSTDQEQVDVFIQSAHELIHSYHHVTGRLDDCRCCEELRTVGLDAAMVGSWSDGITENELRQQYTALHSTSGYSPRQSYPDCEFTTLEELEKNCKCSQNPSVVPTKKVKKPSKVKMSNPTKVPKTDKKIVKGSPSDVN